MSGQICIVPRPTDQAGVEFEPMIGIWTIEDETQGNVMEHDGI